jgi:antitoxin HicB
MRYTVILFPDDSGQISVTVPSMPGCVSQGSSRDEALANVVGAMRGWVEVEAEEGRAPLLETPSLVVSGVSEALQIIDEMRQAGEVPPDFGYSLELVTVDVRQPAAA